MAVVFPLLEKIFEMDEVVLVEICGFNKPAMKFVPVKWLHDPTLDSVVRCEPFNDCLGNELEWVVVEVNENTFGVFVHPMDGRALPVLYGPRFVEFRMERGYNFKPCRSSLVSLSP